MVFRFNAVKVCQVGVMMIVAGIIMGFMPMSIKAQVDADEKTPGGKQKRCVLFDGKSLEHWRIVDIHECARHGKVSAEDGAIVLHTGNPMTGIAYRKVPPRANYEMSFDARRVDGFDFFCGLTFPVGKSYCSLILGGWGGNVVGLSNVDNAAADENETTHFIDFKKGKWYRFRLRVTPEKIELWMDKEKIIDLKTKNHAFSIWWEQEPVRPLGFSAWRTTGALRKIELLTW